MGVSSKSTETSLRIYNGRDKYNEWVFVATQASVRAGGPGGAQTPGGRGGQPPGRGGNTPGRGLGPGSTGGFGPGGGFNQPGGRRGF